MNRRSFVWMLGSGTLGLHAFGPGILSLRRGVHRSTVTSSAFEGWLWIGSRPSKSGAEWRELFAGLRGLGFRGVLVGGPFRPDVAEAARAQGLEYHRWMWILNRAGDSWARDRHPEWFTVSRNGESTLDAPPYVEYYRWVCPSREPVRAYLRRLIDEAAAEPGVDGIHLDYIRHCDVILPRGLWEKYDLVQDRELPEFDFCYCEECRAQFKALGGRDPMAMADPSSDREWARFRWDSVTRVVNELAAATRGRGKTISAAVFATPDLGRRLVRQAWDEWPVDRVFPMLYHPAYGEDVPWIGRSVAQGISALRGSDTELLAGLYVPALDPLDLAEAIELAREAGATGFSLFDLNPLTDDHLAAVGSVMETVPASSGV